jgi:hypothetical protein
MQQAIDSVMGAEAALLENRNAFAGTASPPGHDLQRRAMRCAALPWVLDHHKYTPSINRITAANRNTVKL